MVSAQTCSGHKLQRRALTPPHGVTMIHGGEPHTASKKSAAFFFVLFLGLPPWRVNPSAADRAYFRADRSPHPGYLLAGVGFS